MATTYYSLTGTMNYITNALNEEADGFFQIVPNDRAKSGMTISVLITESLESGCEIRLPDGASFKGYPDSNIVIGDASSNLGDGAGICNIAPYVGADPEQSDTIQNLSQGQTIALSKAGDRLHISWNNSTTSIKNPDIETQVWGANLLTAVPSEGGDEKKDK